MTCLTAASLTSRLARGGAGLALFVDSSVKRKFFLLHHSLCSISSPCFFFFLPALDYLHEERITVGPVRSQFLEENLGGSRRPRVLPGRDEPLLPREVGSAVVGRQVATACEKRDLQEVPVPARFLLKRAIPPVLTAGLCALPIVVAAPLSYSPHCASLRSGRLLKQPGAAR